MKRKENKMTFKASYVLGFCFSVLCLSNSIGAQNLSPNTSKANKALIQMFDKQEEERNSRVQTFLSLNPTVKKSLSTALNTIYIYDIVNNKPIYKSTDNLNASLATKTNHLQAGGSLNLNLDGSGMTIGVWDGGPAQSTHPEFANATNTASRVTIVDNATVDGDTGFSSHGTHVAGTISAKGVSPTAKGMATNVNVKSYNWSNDESEMTAAANAVNPIILSNHSYGVPILQNDGSKIDAWFMGAYTQDARDVDVIAHNNKKYLVVASAGNSGTTTYTGGMYPGYDKLTTDKNAKNSLVIANANPTLTIFTNEINSLIINSSSSQGPTDDLRIKPDLAADGTNLTSSVPTDNYATYSGTSMAAPNTTGTLALLQQYYNQLHGNYMNSSTLKGLVCHTSIDDTNTIGPDPVFGWGFLNAKASAETIASAVNGQSILDELTLSQGQTYSFTFSAQAGDKLSASICWTDMPGTVVSNSDTNSTTARLVNDLDIRLTKDGTTYLPWKLDFNSSSGYSNSKGDNDRDNIERIDIDAPTSGIYTLTVTHKGTLVSNTGGPFDPKDQDYSLILTGNNLVLSTQDNKVLSGLQLYPNPSKGQFTVSFNAVSNDDVKVAVYDVSGKKLFNQNFTNNSLRFNETFNLSTLQSGVYIVNISEGNTTVSKKLIIE